MIPTQRFHNQIMNFLRAMLIWVLALSLPVEGMAANLMTHCKDMQMAGVATSAAAMSHHDHAAMMAMGAMADDPSMAQMHHHTAKQSHKALKPGCQCGCKCGGDCALSCSGMMVPLALTSLPMDSRTAAFHMLMPRGQAHAAYRYEPLRPPSAVAL